MFTNELDNKDIILYKPTLDEYFTNIINVTSTRFYIKSRLYYCKR